MWNIWIDAAGAGIYIHNGKKFDLFNKTNRIDLIPNFSIQSILEDSNGTILFGF